MNWKVFYEVQSPNPCWNGAIWSTETSADHTIIFIHYGIKIPSEFTSTQRETERDRADFQEDLPLKYLIIPSYARGFCRWRMSGGESLALAALTCFGPTERKRTWRAYICRTHGGNFLMMESCLLESLLRLDPNTMLLSASDMSYPHRQTDRQKEFKSFCNQVCVLVVLRFLCIGFFS